MSIFLIIMLIVTLSFGTAILVLAKIDIEKCCMYSEMLEEFFNNSFDDENKELVKEHLLKCESCREDLEEIGYIDDILAIVKDSYILSPERKKSLCQKILEKMSSCKK